MREIYTTMMINPLNCLFGIEVLVALNRNPGPVYNTLFCD